MQTIDEESSPPLSVAPTECALRNLALTELEKISRNPSM
jgi:hypothetical protein